MQDLHALVHDTDEDTQGMYPTIFTLNNGGSGVNASLLTDCLIAVAPEHFNAMAAARLRALRQGFNKFMAMSAVEDEETTEQTCMAITGGHIMTDANLNFTQEQLLSWAEQLRVHIMVLYILSAESMEYDAEIEVVHTQITAAVNTVLAMHNVQLVGW